MSKPTRSDIRVGQKALITVYDRRRSHSIETLSVGIVSDILTRRETHPYGIKVRLDTGHEGRVQWASPSQ